MPVDSDFRVLVLVHSHVYWLSSFVQSARPSPLVDNLSVRNICCEVHYEVVRWGSGAAVPTLLDVSITICRRSCSSSANEV